MAPSPRSVALLRGINVGGKHRVPMAELRALAEGLSWRDVRTVIQSGNLLFTAAGTEDKQATALERALAAEFGFEVPVVVRRRDALQQDLDGCPFGDALASRPNLLHAGWSRAALSPRLATAIEPYAKAGERIAVRGGCLWIDFENGVARSKVTSAVLDRLVGSSVTMRNGKTLAAILAADDASPRDE